MNNAATIFRELGAPETQKYVLANPTEIAGVLSELRTRRVRPSLYYGPENSNTCLSMILEVDLTANRFIFDIDRNEIVNERIQRADRIAWVGWIDGVKVSFACEPPRRVRYEGDAAFVAPLPTRVLRAQRRNAFRASTPVSQPLMCRIDPTGAGRLGLPLRVVDISTLGLCLLVDIEELPWRPGASVPTARVDLPGHGPIECGFEVRYVIPAGARHPAQFRRCGVQFVGMAARDSVLIQRYINDLQRERLKVKTI